VASELQCTARDSFGRSNSRRLRRQGQVPAIVYGGGTEPAAISLDQNHLRHEMAREAFYTSILSIKVGNDSQQVVVKAVHRHPFKPLVLHLDFQRVLEDREITLNVPIHFIGEEDAVGVRDQGGVVERLQTDVEISCLPKYLPEFLELDVSSLELNQLMHLSDIKLPEGVTSVALSHDLDNPVVAVNPPRREEIDEVPEEELAEGELPEGEVPAEGEAEEGETKAEGDDEKSGD